MITLPKWQSWLYATICYGSVVLLYLSTSSADLSELPQNIGLAIGVVGIWRYGWLMVHLVRSICYQFFIYPSYRLRANSYIKDLQNYPAIGVIIPSYKMPELVFDQVFLALFTAGINYTGNVYIVAAVTTQEELDKLQKLFSSYKNQKNNLHLELFIQDGTGKRAAMAQALRKLRHLATVRMVVLMDGDSVISPQIFQRLTGFFETQPDLGAFTIDNNAKCINASSGIAAWYSLRMLQRHWLMSSISLSRRVLVLTGRFSVIRGDLANQDGFIEAIADDHVNHWRYGRLSMLTGDDKSTWFYILKTKLAMIYIPDVSCDTFETPVNKYFLINAKLLMQRWFGNMIRTSDRAILLGPQKMPFFFWWCLVDQRISSWTAMMGPMGIGMLAVVYHYSLIPIYLMWVLFTRVIFSIILCSIGRQFNPYYPALLFFGQVFGAVIKNHIMFRLHLQRWNRHNVQLHEQSTEQKYVAIIFEIISYVVFMFVLSFCLGVL